MIGDSDVRRYDRLGYLVVPGAVGPERIRVLLDELDRWIEESRSHTENFGELPNGKPRFDLEPGHTAARPRLRRISNPADISEVYRDFVWTGPFPDLATPLLGPDIKFHHSKLNIKLPGMDARVLYHQDHAFTPHTNDSMLSVLLLLDRQDEDNGCLRVVPGTHRRQVSHYRKGEFTATVSLELQERFDRESVPIIGDAGDVCIFHTWCVHGSGPNRTDRPRRVFITDFTAADAFPLVNNIPSRLAGEIVRGKPSHVARIQATRIELPPLAGESVFVAQGQGKANAM